ncbi:hypothetical protein [Haliangium ochraceum]|uniref:Uncharacterized protein n=1 Tax=Haliangium ochraceum (strain DSM 14365 / JCM 11303 / SMP-2) TaxID=502025 RepID=D0LFY8_HALO1|nr:hypothetical protein [Haliangium ochraceum]ACY14590.1 hypothetical protein Hoch_2045 [Haliangium ochraceum DSM 14365]
MFSLPLFSSTRTTSTRTMTSRAAMTGAACALLMALPAAAHAERVIDSFANAFPQTTVPGTSTQAPILWAGSLNGSTRSGHAVSQSGLNGVIGGSRYAMVQESTRSNSVIASTGPAGNTNELSYATGSGPSGILTLEYGRTSDLNADLWSDGGVAFEFEVDGDMDDSSQPRPVSLLVTVESNGGAVRRSASITVVDDGVYQIPYSSFPGIDFSDVDTLRFRFDASQVNSIDYLLVGGLRTTNCLQSGTAYADVFLDTFETALPTQSIPGLGSLPMLWAGTINGVSQLADFSSLTGVFGAIGGQRYAAIEASDINNFLSGIMLRDNGTPLFGYATSYTTSGELFFAYGAQTDLNADLSDMVAFELELDGDLASGSPRPVPLTVTVASGSGSAATQVTLLANGTYYVPFTSLPGVNFSDVDFVQFRFDASQVQAVDFDLIGGLRASACIP